MSVAITDFHCLFISFNQDILKITADNFIYKLMISLKDLLLSQQQEKKNPFFVILVPSNSSFSSQSMGKILNVF